jgi:hypothetical protein
MRNTQYLVIDSDFVHGTNNNFVVTFGITSNTFIQEMKDVIAVKLVDIYITQIGVASGGADNAPKYVDVICPDIPLAGQMLSERTGQVFVRVPLERNTDGGQNFVVRDKEWKPYSHETRYFNPISINKLAFQLWEYQGDGDYVPLQAGCEFFMVLEITTVDHKAPPEDKLVTVIERLEEISDKMDKISRLMIRAQSEKIKKKKKWPVSYLVGGAVGVVLVVYLIRRSFRTSSVPGPAPGLGQPLGAPRPLGAGPAPLPQVSGQLGLRPGPPLRQPV